MPKWEGVETVLFYMNWVEGKLAVLHKWPDTTKLGTAGHRRQDIMRTYRSNPNRIPAVRNDNIALTRFPLRSEPLGELKEKLYSILAGSPRRIEPPRATAAYTPTLTWLCCAAVRRIPGSHERSPCARVVITQRPQGPVMFRRTAVPMASV